jgi:hypothetical protein
MPKELPLFFPGRGGPDKGLNKRLPETTASDVLPSVPFRDSSSDQGVVNLTRVETVRGSRLFNAISGLPRAETNIAGFLGTL